MRSESVNLAHTEKEEITPGCEYQETGVIGVDLRACPVQNHFSEENITLFNFSLSLPLGTPDYKYLKSKTVLIQFPNSQFEGKPEHSVLQCSGCTQRLWSRLA